jgi:hypothetical protein
MAIPPGHLGRCPTCERKMKEQQVAVYDSQGVRYVTGYVCTHCQDGVDEAPKNGMKAERSLQGHR